MSIIELFLQELDQEAVTTRKMLERVPNDQFDWKPHEKSMTVRQLTTHIAELPSWISMILTTSELDFAANPYDPPKLNTGKELLELFEKSFADGKAHLEKATEKDLQELWILRDGDNVYLKLPKVAMIRTTFSQIIHHRAQLGVDLRLLNIAIPGSYGPSADEGF